MYGQTAGRSLSASETANIMNNEGRLIIYYDAEEREIKRMQKGRGRLPIGAFLDGSGNYAVKVGFPRTPRASNGHSEIHSYHAELHG